VLKGRCILELGGGLNENTSLNGEEGEVTSSVIVLPKKTEGRKKTPDASLSKKKKKKKGLPHVASNCWFLCTHRSYSVFHEVGPKKEEVGDLPRQDNE